MKNIYLINNELSENIIIPFGWAFSHSTSAANIVRSCSRRMDA